MAVQEPVPPLGWSLNQRELENLLRALHSDPEAASHAYEALRLRLIQFFAWNRVEMPEALADRTLDRLARRVSSGDEPILDPVRFCVGIARLMLKEYAREKGHEKETLAALSDHLNDLAYRNHLSAQAEEQSHVLQSCLERLPVASRSLIERYFSTEGRNHIEARQHLAQQCGISMNALRNRVLRIRAELERCFSARSQQLDPTGPEMFPSQMTQEDDEQ